MSYERRKALLQAGLKDAEAQADQLGHPFELISQKDHEAVFAVTQPPNHWLHKRLTIQTLGLWAPVWWFQSRRGMTRRVFRATVSESGGVKVARVRD